MEKLELLGMEDFKNKSFNNLSGGQKQRVLLARALCKAKKIIVLDEPTTGIDKETTKILYFIVELLNQQGVTIITVSHDLEKLLKGC
ncbi:MAG: ATP-binding cassette domain-containing protein [Clostridium sp.]|nr:MAG: ATP-binding cassette domain-containing protein [Clostridium sp.]